MVYRSSRAPGRTTRRSDDDGGRPHNAFRNDGSFLEMFKKMQEGGGAASPGAAPAPPASPPAAAGGTSSPPPPEPKGHTSPGPSAAAAPPASAPPPAAAPGPPKAPFVGKRRGGRVLPTGKVKRLKPESDSPSELPKDAWSAYLAEVKRYKETTCEEDGKTRPLVK